jgi:NAD(P)-dependent dehydrogenase (short-subunit alcohol dehydrogenase family)
MPCCRGRPAPKAWSRCSAPWASPPTIRKTSAPSSTAGAPPSIIKRLTKPEEIADVVAFLVSREAGAISGSPVRADGGVVLSIT